MEERDAEVIRDYRGGLRWLDNGGRAEGGVLGVKKIKTRDMKYSQEEKVMKM